MSDEKKLGLDANENVVHHEISKHLSLEHCKLNRNCPISLDSKNYTSLRLEIPSSNDSDYAREVFDNLGASVRKLNIEKLGDKLECPDLKEKMFRYIPQNFLLHFPELEELHNIRMHELDNVEIYPPKLETLHFRYLANYPSEKFIENIRKIKTLKVLKADELGLSEKDTDHKESTEFVKLEAPLWCELKKIYSTKLEASISICTDKNLLEETPIQLQDVTGILIDPIYNWEYESFAGLEKFKQLRKLHINLDYGNANRCLSIHEPLSCPSMKELCLEGPMRRNVCDRCVSNLIKSCPNLTSLTLKEEFNVVTVHKALEQHQLEVFRFKNFRCLKKLPETSLSKLTTLETTLDWDEVENWPEMKELRKLIVFVRPEIKIGPLGIFLKKCPNLTCFKLSSVDSNGFYLYGLTRIIAGTLPSIEYLRIKIYNQVNYSKLEPLIACKHLKVLHLITFPDYSNHPFHDRTETLTFDTELKLFNTIPTLNLIIINTEYGKRYFYRGDLFDLRSYFKENIMKYREPQKLANYIRTNLMSNNYSGRTNPANSKDLSDVSEYLGVEVHARTMEASLVKGFLRALGNNVSDIDNSYSSDDSHKFIMECSSASSDYNVLSMEGKFTDNSDDTGASDVFSDD